MKKLFTTVLCSLFFLLVSAQSNEGTDFWLGFMEHFDRGQNTMVVMVTAKNNTSGTISMPGIGWSQNVTVTANQVSLIRLPAQAENLDSESIANRGVYLSTLDPVSVYIHQYHSFRAEASIVLPTEVLGLEYYIMSYPGISEQGGYFPSEFLLVGTRDDTEVTISLSADTQGGRSAGTSFSIRLDAGETYQVQSRGVGDDLTGTYIQSDQQLAVFGGCQWVEIPNGCDFRDNLLEQMYPLSTWGRQFLTIPSARVSYDIYRIMAAEDNTSVELDGDNPQVFNLDAGQFVEYRRSLPAFIRADKPIQMAQYLVGSNCNGLALGDPAFVLLNSVEQTRDTVTLHNSSFQNISENYINIIAQTADIDNINIDGQPVAAAGATFVSVGANAGFSYAQVRVSAGSHTITSSGCGVIATAYGYGDLESYAYSGGAAFTAINANAIPEGGCLNDTILFDTGLSPDRYTARWDLGDGNIVTQHQFGHVYRQLGIYEVSLITYDRCLEESDTSRRDLRVSLRQAVAATDWAEVCVGDSFQLEASDLAGADYEWRGPGGYYSEAQMPSFVGAVSQTGTYSVIGIISGCATFPAEATVVVHPTPRPDLGPDTLICSRSADFDLVLDPGNYSSYRWQDNSRTATYPVQTEGQYQVTVTDAFGCVGQDDIVLAEQCPTRIYAPNAFSPNEDGVNDRFRLFALDVSRLELKVFDRWGNLVFTSTDPETGWDGTWGNRPADKGVYAWMVSFDGFREDGTTFSGTESGSVTLIR